MMRMPCLPAVKQSHSNSHSSNKTQMKLTSKSSFFKYTRSKRRRYTYHVKTSPERVREVEWIPPRAILRTPSRLGFKVGTKMVFSSPNPSLPPSPFPHIQNFPSTSKAEWKSPHETPTSTFASAADPTGGEGRRP